VIPILNFTVILKVKAVLRKKLVKDFALVDGTS